MATTTKGDVFKIRATREQVLAELGTLLAAPLPRQEAHALLEEALAAATAWETPSWLAGLARGDVPPPAELSLFVSSAQEASGLVILPGQAVPLPRNATDAIEIPAQRAVVRTITTSLVDRGRDAFLLTVAGAQIAEACHSRLDQLYDANGWDTLAVPAAERATRRAALTERLAALELEEEMQIVTLERAGMVIDRRGDVDGAALFHESVLALEAAP